MAISVDNPYYKILTSLVNSLQKENGIEAKW